MFRSCKGECNVMGDVTRIVLSDVGQYAHARVCVKSFSHETFGKINIIRP